MNKVELENGILDDKMDELISQIRSDYKIEYEIIELYDGLINRLINSLLSKGATKQNVYILSNIIEMQKLYQSSILLLERGVPECAYILNRTMIEIVINITEVINNPDEIDNFLIDNDFEVKNAIEYLKKTSIEIPQELIDKINEVRGLDKLGKRNNKRVTKKLAEKNGMNEMYALFKFKSDFTHMSTDILGHLIKEIDGKYFVDARLKYDDLKMDIGFVFTIIWSMIEVILEKYHADVSLINEFKEINKKFESQYK